MISAIILLSIAFVFFVLSIVIFVYYASKEKQIDPKILTYEKIPRILHFIYGLWDTKEMPLEYKNNIENWKKSYPDFEIKIWNKEQCESLLEYYPEEKLLYDKFSERKVMRADLMRYIIVNEFGGFYLDLDCQVSSGQRLEKLLEKELILFTETTLTESQVREIAKIHNIRKNQKEKHLRIANYSFGSEPFHPYWLKVLNLIKERSSLEVLEDYDIIYITGPDIISEVREDEEVLDLNTSLNYFKHTCSGSWRKKNDR